MAGTTTLLLGMNLCSSPVLAETVDSTDAGVDTSTPQTTGSTGTGTKGGSAGSKDNEAGSEDLSKEEQNSTEDKDLIQNSGNKDKGQTTENETKPVINKMSKDELKKCVKDVSENNPLGMAGIFHIFGNEVDSSSHIAGNIATDKMNGAGDFGSADGATCNSTTGDIQYFDSIKQHFNQFDGNNRAIVFGPDIEL